MENDKGESIMTRRELVIFVVIITIPLVVVGVIVKMNVWPAEAYQAALTAALVAVTAAYVVLTSKVVTASREQTRIMQEQQRNNAAPVVMLSCTESRGANEVEINVGWRNIGKGPALNFRCWIEDPEHPELRALDRAICRTAVEVALSDVISPAIIHTGIPDYKLGAGYIRAQYESVFKITYESCLSFSENAAPELRYGEAEKDDIVIL